MRDGDAIEAAAVSGPEPPATTDGFVLEEIEMRGFMRYLERTDPPLRFPEKFTVITGRTGAGKSSILDAVTFALFGNTARTDLKIVKTSDICRPGGYVRIAFHQGEERWEVTRGFTTKKDSYLEVVRDGDAVQGTIPEKEQTVRDVIGLDYVGFCNATFVRQEEMKELGSQSGANRLAVFQKLFRLEIFERALDRAKEHQTVLQTDLKAKDAEIATRAEALASLPAIRVQLAESEDAIRTLRDRVAALASGVAAAEESLKTLELRHTDWVKATSAVADRIAQLEQVRKRLDEMRLASDQAAALQAQLEDLESQVADLEILRGALEKLRERMSAHELLQSSADSAVRIFDQAKRDHERRRDQIKDKIDVLHRKIAGLTTDVDRDAAFDSLRTEGRLEERVSRIDRELAWVSDRAELVRELQEEQRRAEKALDNARAKVRAINADSFLLTEHMRQVEELKEDLRKETDESHRILAPLDDAKVGALRALDAAPFADGDRTRVAETARLVQEKMARRKQADELTVLLKEASQVTARIAELEEQRRELEKERAAMETEVARLKAHEDSYQAARSNLETRRRSLEAERKSLHTAEGQAGGLRTQIERLEADTTRLVRAERERDEIRSRLEILEVLVTRVFHKRGVVMYAIDQLLPELEIEASKNLAELTDGRFTRIKLETYEEGRGHGIRILVQGVDQRWHDVGEFSGGEKTQINAALRFAIARELASMPHAGRAFGRMKTLFIDEGDLGSLDTEVSRELFVQKLFRMGEFFDKVILITHLAEVADRFPGRIRVTMSPSQESRVEVLA
ncbi:MAG TPA: SMC family ATPase [Thermoplasmata archaeon]|nr:SMC family ATPase [Thermoplasmata archaeon]